MRLLMLVVVFLSPVQITEASNATNCANTDVCKPNTKGCGCKIIENICSSVKKLSDREEQNAALVALIRKLVRYSKFECALGVVEMIKCDEVKKERVRQSVVRAKLRSALSGKWPTCGCC